MWSTNYIEHSKYHMQPYRNQTTAKPQPIHQQGELTTTHLTIAN